MFNSLSRRSVRHPVFVVAMLGLLFFLFPQATVARAPSPVKPKLRSSLEPVVPLEEGWNTPPRMSRAKVYWWWPNGNVTKESITSDLEALNAKGFGGGMITDAAAKEGNVPHGPTFASPEWRELFVHALNEAERLNLELSFNIQSGWNLGGPDVTPEHASKKLTFSEKQVEGGKKKTIQLPRPDTKGGYYRDVSVVAYPVRKSGDGDRPDVRVTASIAKSSYPSTHAIDRRPETFWVGGTPDRRPTSEHPEWIELQFDEPVRANRMQLLPRPGYGPKRARLVAYVNGNPREITSFSMDKKGKKELEFDPVTASRWRVIVSDAYDPRQPNRPRNVQIAELDLFQEGQSLLPDRKQRPRVKNWKKKAYYQLPGSFTAPETWFLLETARQPVGSRAIDPDQVVHLSDQLRSNGTLEWDVPEGRWTVLRFGSTLTGADVSTHSDGWSGLAIDYLDRDAFRRYWKRVLTPILEEAGPYVGSTLRFLHTDSWELGAVNWTDGMAEEFERLREYEIDAFWPVLAGRVVQNREVSTRFLNDFRTTISDLIARNKYLTFSKHAQNLNMGIHPESGGPHAAPIDALKQLGRGDIPMGEFWARSETHRVSAQERLFMKQPASAAHTYGKRLVQGEGFTTIGPHWEQDPERLKPVFDRELTEGLNLLMWHTFASSPESMGIPGQAYFAGTHLNPRVTWWDQSGAFIDYINRSQFLLQQGLFVGDVVYYYGENIPSFVRLQKDDPAGVGSGYDYDVINTEALLNRTSVDDQGRVILPDGTRYRVLVLPDYDAYSLKTLKHVASLVRRGATVIGKKPSRPYSLTGSPKADKSFTRLAGKMWGDSGGSSSAPNRYGDGRMFHNQSARKVLKQIGIPPDVTYEGSKDNALVNYIHRRTSDGHIYFVINRRDRREQIELSFRVQGKQPELWNPRTGERRNASAFRQDNGRTYVPYTFAPYGSVFVLFRRSTDKSTSGKSERNVRTYRAKQTIPGPWTVHFDPEWGGPETVQFKELTDWTNRAEPGIKYYSGEATYVKSFDLPLALKQTDDPIQLDLGSVQNLARVRLNGQNLGVTWKTPFRYDIDDVVQPTDNTLRITVVNLWPNRIIGDRRRPDEKQFTKTNVQKFDRDSSLIPSGLLGPVTIGIAR